MIWNLSLGSVIRVVVVGSVPFHSVTLGRGPAYPGPWTPMLRPFVSRLNELAQEGRRLADDVCKYMHDM